MILVKPSFQILNHPTNLELIELAGRVCYKSEGKIGEGTDTDFVRSLIRRGHESVIEHLTITVKIICDRGVTHEIVRHRLASYSQESTRYCNYKGGVTFVIPPWVVDIKPGNYLIGDTLTAIYDEVSISTSRWLTTLCIAEGAYASLVSEYDWSPQQARSVLPNSLKTEIVVTANLREWRHILRLRCAPSAHPQMSETMIPILAKFKRILPPIFEDINV